MGLFSRAEQTKKKDTQSPRSLTSSNPARRPQPHVTDRRTPDNHPGRPVSVYSSPPHPPDPSISIFPQTQNTIKVFPRPAEDLYREAFHQVNPHDGTDYPCTPEDLSASGGVTRRLPLRRHPSEYESRWFTSKKKWPSVDPETAAREVFDHNDPERIPSADEDEAIGRLVTGIRNAGQRKWGPDLAIKAFCDLDKVFFSGKLRGNVCLAWEQDSSSLRGLFALTTVWKTHGKCLIQLNAYWNIFMYEVHSNFAQMFATLLHEMCHAYVGTRIRHDGRREVAVNASSHDENFGTMLHAVNTRAMKLLDLEGDPNEYPRHIFSHDGDSSTASEQVHLYPKQPPFHELPLRPKQPRPAPQRPAPRLKQPGPAPKQHSSQRRYPGIPSRQMTSPKSPLELYHDAFNDVFLDTGTKYDCKQNDLDATGGLARQLFPDDSYEDQGPSREKWFINKKRPRIITPRRATLDITRHNDLDRTPSETEEKAIERLSKAIDEGRKGCWGPDLIIKAFCDLDTVFFKGRLRGHVCVRWLPNWGKQSYITWGNAYDLGEAKSVIKLNAETILLQYPDPFERMFGTMLHNMCIADAHTQLSRDDAMACTPFDNDVCTKFSAIERRLRKLFDLSLKCHLNETSSCPK